MEKKYKNATIDKKFCFLEKLVIKINSYNSTAYNAIKFRL